MARGQAKSKGQAESKGRAKSPSYKAAREETSALTEGIEKIEKEIDERVRALYGLTEKKLR